MENKKFIITASLLLMAIGVVFIFWGATTYMNYPHLRELMRAAFRTMWWKDVIGIVCVIGGYIVGRKY